MTQRHAVFCHISQKYLTYFCRHIFSSALIALSLSGLSAQAATLTVAVTDSANAPIENAVVYAEPVVKGNAAAAPAIVEQRGREFKPLVSVVQTGSNISFPNFDSVRHHVYSFSPAKTFELKLYSGVPTAPVLFDKAGTVVLGCNIHDFMVAFIHVVDTPYFAKTDKSGKAFFADLPNGSYVLKTWHYAQVKEKEIAEQPLVMTQAQSASMKLTLKPFLLPARK